MFRGDRGDEMVGDWVFDHPGLLRSGQWRTLLRELRAHGSWRGRSLRSVLRRDLLAPLLDDLTRRSPRPPGAVDLERRLPPYVRADWARSVGLEATLGANAPAAPPMDSARRRRYERVFFFRGLRDPAVMEARSARHEQLHIRTYALGGEVIVCRPRLKVRGATQTALLSVRREVLMQKATYIRPTVKALGSVADLTRTVYTPPNDDGKGGSVDSRDV